MGRYSRIITGSMGNFLAPPNHPSHSYEVETDIRRKKENRGSTNLEYATTDWGSIGLDPDTIKKAKQLLLDWENSKLPLDNQITKQWIQACQKHMGAKHVEYVQKYYPEYK